MVSKKLNRENNQKILNKKKRPLHAEVPFFKKYVIELLHDHFTGNFFATNINCVEVNT